MRRLLLISLLLGSLTAVFAAGITKGRVVKVLPVFLNLKGEDAVTPSLYDRDAYQVYLRQHPDERSGLRFSVLWQVENPAAAKYKIRVEIRGIATNGEPRQLTLEEPVTPQLLRKWTRINLTGDGYKNFGELVAWRATLWSDDQLMSEQKSFLW